MLKTEAYLASFTGGKKLKSRNQESRKWDFRCRRQRRDGQRRASWETSEFQNRKRRFEFSHLGFLASSFHVFVFVFASSTARLIAAIMLSGRAIPLPAISNAVPWSGLVRGNGSPRVTFTPLWKACSFNGINPRSWYMQSTTASS